MHNLINIQVTLNKLNVKSTNIDEMVGEVIFTSQSGNDFEAFFCGNEIIPSNYANVEFCSLDYDLDWNIIFTENKSKIKKLIKEKGYCSYQSYGQILSINPTVVDFGDIIMEIGLSTNDEKVVGEFIYWKIDRLDILKISCA